MATINYNGMEPEEVTEPQIFDPPQEMLVIDEYGDKPIKKKVAAILATGYSHNVVATDNSFWQSCFCIPDPSKPRRATNRELARWLARGNGQIQYDDKTKNFGKSPDGERHNALKSTTIFEYFGADDFYVAADIRVRKWHDTEWHEPTVDYLGIDDKDYNFNKKYGEN